MRAPATTATPRNRAGVVAMACAPCPVDTAWAIACACPPRGVALSPPAIESRTREANTVPSAATPVASPTWRSVRLIPAAIPASSGSTTPTLVETSGTFTNPIPTPAMIMPFSRCVQSDAAVSPRIRMSPVPMPTNPAPIRIRRGTLVVSRPAIPDATKLASVSGRSRTPVSIAESPRLAWK